MIYICISLLPSSEPLPKFEAFQFCWLEYVWGQQCVWSLAPCRKRWVNDTGPGPVFRLLTNSFMFLSPVKVSRCWVETRRARTWWCPCTKFLHETTWVTMVSGNTVPALGTLCTKVPPKTWDFPPAEWSCGAVWPLGSLLVFQYCESATKPPHFPLVPISTNFQQALESNEIWFAQIFFFRHGIRFSYSFRHMRTLIKKKKNNYSLWKFNLGNRN